MKKMLLFSVLILSMMTVFACKSTPEPAPTPDPAPTTSTPAPATPTPAPATSTPSTPAPTTPAPVTPAPVTPTRDGLILDGSTTHTVRSGDYLAAIAWNYYRDGYFYPVIMLGSRDVVLDPDKIDVGMLLTIPDLEKNLNDAGTRARIKQFLLEIAVIEDSRGRHETAQGIRQRANEL